MSKEIESIASEVFDLIRNRFSPVSLGNESAKATTDPESARFFNFSYKTADDTEFGTITISLIDEQSLKVYYSQSITGDMDREQRKEWYAFLRHLRFFAKENILTFDTRDINKSNLNLQDIKQQAKSDDVAQSSDVKVTESKLYGTPGRPYNSFSEKGNTKLLVRHKEKVDPEVRGARTRRIDQIFLETERGERFLLNHTNLHGAYAMAEHLNDGGSIFDSRAEHINNIVDEMNSMRHFVRATKHRQFEDAETADMSRSAVHHYDQLKRKLRMMRGARGYKSYFETWQPDPPREESIDIDALRERFVKKVYDDRFTEALPIVWDAYKKYQNEAAGQLGSELEEWADSVFESNWATPDNDDKVRALQELLRTPLTVGIDGIDAQTKIEIIIGDDNLNDAIYQLSKSQGPDADATSLIKTWLGQNMPDILAQLDIGDNNSRDAQTDWQSPISPENNNHEYGDTAMDWPQENPIVKEDDSLDFLRSLAGIQK
jgi:hypothetical protein